MSIIHNFVQEERFDEYFKGMAVTLLEITKDCRHSMHEPDEQGITATVTGENLDNAGFDSEYHVNLSRDNGTLRKATFNLASLIALARIGAEVYLHEIGED